MPNKIINSRLGNMISLTTLSTRAIKTPTESNIQKAVENGDILGVENGYGVFVINNVVYTVAYNSEKKVFEIVTEQHKAVPVFLPTTFNGVRLTEKAEKELLSLDKTTCAYKYRYKECDYIIKWSDKRNDYVAFSSNGEIVDIIGN